MDDLTPQVLAAELTDTWLGCPTCGKPPEVVVDKKMRPTIYGILLRAKGWVGFAKCPSCEIGHGRWDRHASHCSTAEAKTEAAVRAALRLAWNSRKFHPIPKD